MAETGEQPGSSFPTTYWSRILEARSGPGKSGGATSPKVPGSATSPLESLAERYWLSIRSYLKTGFGFSSPEADDLTQSFFVWVMEGDFLGRATPERGRFRGFVKVALKHFVRDELRRRNRKKRGGGRKLVSLSSPPSEQEPGFGLDVADPQGKTPDAVLDEEWKRTVLQSTLEELRRECEEAGRRREYSVFRDYFLEEEEKASYADLASRYGGDVTEISNLLMRVKRRYRRVLRRVVSETVGGNEELMEELAWLMGHE